MQVSSKSIAIKMQIYKNEISKNGNIKLGLNGDEAKRFLCMV